MRSGSLNRLSKRFNPQRKLAMDIKRTIITVALAMLILIGWEKMFPSAPLQNATPQASAPAPAPQQTTNSAAALPLHTGTPISVQTDLFKAVIDEESGMLNGLTLLQYDSAADASRALTLFADGKPLTYVAQSQLIDENGNNLLEGVSFSAAQKNYVLQDKTLEVRLSAPEKNGLKIDKVYTFTQNSYVIHVRFEVQNNSATAQKIATSYSIVRDNSAPEGEGWFMRSYHGPVVYTPDVDEFEKVDYAQLDEDFQSGKSEAEYQRKATGGYVGMIQHYFVSAWIMQPEKGNNICANTCAIDIKRRADNLYSAGVNTAISELASGSNTTLAAQLYAGPQVTRILQAVAPQFELTKDYGRVHIFAAPLFALLNWLHGIVKNWGWAIILLTIIVKAILYPLNDKAYKSMAKMRTVAPKMEALKKQYSDDRMGLQQAMMQLYQKEQINPLGGCLPILVQMPIFIGLYWMIFLSVELRQAPWLGWIHDLSRPDPFYILPILMAVTMWFQTKLNPPPSDPMQAQMMKIMPLMFSVMFFFFPAGLVLYYVINNLLTIAQQWYINKKIAATTTTGAVEILDKEPANKKTKKK